MQIRGDDVNEAVGFVHRTAQSIKPGSVCRHLKIAGRVIISRFFHITNHNP
jgi:hypothetical protein